MTNFKLSIFFLLVTFFTTSAQETSYSIQGLNEPVEIIVDAWGIPHIYAQNEADLFFAQGFNAARDRLFQFEVWRRQATGTVAEILGERELKRDIGTRLFKFRGDIKKEMNYYHSHGEIIITSYVKGVNAYIELTEKNPNLLPPEFALLGIKPQKWTPEIVISRHQGLLGNIKSELKIGRQVALFGEEKTKELNWFHPKEPNISLDKKINGSLLSDDILELYNAYRQTVKFQPDDLVGEVKNDFEKYQSLAQADDIANQLAEADQYNNIGSNNWVVNGTHTQSGFPMMANDPHRSLAAPSLRYYSHLVAPGWNVIGGGEPEIPGISIGHNEYGAWGLTVFRTDAEDLYVYGTNPKNPQQYIYEGGWEDMKIIKDTIYVKGSSKPFIVELKYTRHGPVVSEDEKNNKAYAVRCGWLEVGGSPYLASLRMNQAKNFEEFREACKYSHIPGENMAWADREGHIGWQAVGIAPIRRNWSGLVPVPGDGSYEWDGYLPIKAKPNLFDPPSGIFITANEDVTPKDYEYWDAIGFSWSDPYRGDRVAEVLGSGRKHSLLDMAALQTDVLSIPARQLVPLLKNLKTKNPRTEKALQYLLNWDFNLDKNSIAAAIYLTWEKQLKKNISNRLIPSNAREYFSDLPMKKVMDHLVLPDGKFGKNPVQGRDEFLMKNLNSSIDELSKKLGEDMTHWQYGQLKFKHVLIKHPLSNAVNDEWRKKLEVGPAPRGGNSYTANAASNNDNQSHGATFRIIVDTGDWDHCLGSNAPGQSGNPNHKNYRNLFDLWVNDEFFPVFFSREKIESVKDETFKLLPK
jgi:penicillin amidase